MRHLHPRLALATLVTGALLIAIFSVAVVLVRSDLREDIHQKMFERDAAVLQLVAESQLRDAESDPNNHAFASEMLLPSILKMVRGMLGGAIFDVEGNILQTAPSSLGQVELTPDDFARLSSGAPISRFQPEFPLDQLLPEFREPRAAKRQPILVVMLPLHAGDGGQTIGFVKFFLHAQRLAAELEAIDARIERQTRHTLVVGSALIALILAGAYFGLGRAQRIIAERNERLARANFELTLAAKTSALGVITSHLIHGLQGPVAGLRAMMADHAAGDGVEQSEWQSAASYTERMQSMIHETVALLGDTSTQTSYELTATELVATIRDRNHAAAVAKGVAFAVQGGFDGSIDSHRGSLICLIATNLVQNAIEATDPGRHVTVMLGDDTAHFVMTVSDEGAGIPEQVREHLFEPGRTGRPGGTGLGLAISQLLARQIGSTLALIETGTRGTTFQLTVPRG